MRTGILALLGGLLLAAPAWAQPVKGADPQKAQRDLQTILLPDPEFDSGSYRKGLDDAILEARITTRPFSTRFPGLCRHDRLIVGYAGFDDSKKYTPDHAGEPFTVMAEARYRVIEDRVTIPGSDYKPYHPFKGECTRQDARAATGWFHAKDAYVAAFGYNDLIIAWSTIREGKRSIPGCHEKNGEQSYLCADFAAIDPRTDVTELIDCAAKAPDTCYLIRLSNNDMVTIRLEYRPSPRDNRLESIEIDRDNTIMVSGAPRN